VDADPAVLGPQPDNVYVDRFIPQAQVLSHSRVMVSHAGSGAMLGAANAAVPILAMPQGADQFMNAARIVDTGLGLQLWPNDTTADAVLDGVRRLIEDDRFADRATAIQHEIAAMPSPASVVERLVAFSEGR
jgi:MGT family glycosyltransferase